MGKYGLKDERGIPRVKADAEEIAGALGGVKRGENWLCFCPVHDDATRSLSVKDGKRGKLLIYCFAGCSFLALRESLERLGLDI